MFEIKMWRVFFTTVRKLQRTYALTLHHRIFNKFRNGISRRSGQFFEPVQLEHLCSAHRIHGFWSARMQYIAPQHKRTLFELIHINHGKQLRFSHCSITLKGKFSTLVQTACKRFVYCWKHLHKNCKVLDSCVTYQENPKWWSVTTFWCPSWLDFPKGNVLC